MTPTPAPAATIDLPHPAAIVPAHPYPATARSRSSRRPRHLTMGYLPAVWPAYTPRPDPLPYLRLRGRWLQEAGFTVGAKIRVRVERNRLILEVISDPDQRSDATACTFAVHDPKPARIDMGAHIV